MLKWILGIVRRNGGAGHDGEGESSAVPSVGGVRQFRLLTEKELSELPPPEWLIDKLLPATSVGLLFGKPGVGKTFLALDWSLCMVEGRSWSDRTIPQASVVYVHGEGHGGIGERISAWRSLNEQSYDVSSPHRLLTILGAVNLSVSAEVTALISCIRACVQGGTETPRLIVIDTLARCTVGAEENSAKDMGLVVRSLDRIRESLHATVLLVHHQGHEGNHARGSSAIPGALDSSFRLEKDPYSTYSLTLKCTKQKEAPAADTVNLLLTKSGQSLAVVVQGTSARSIETGGLNGSQSAALVALAQSGPGGLRYTNWKTTSGLGNSTFDRARDRLGKRGFVTKDGSIYAVTEAGRGLLPEAPNASDETPMGPDQPSPSSPTPL